jgi:hypothetical protein
MRAVLGRAAGPARERPASFFVRPPDGVHGYAHARDAHTPAADALPGVDAIHESYVGIRLKVLTQPRLIYPARIVAAYRLVLHVAGFSKPTQQPAHRRLTYSKQLCCLFVRSASLRLVRLDKSPP